MLTMQTQLMSKPRSGLMGHNAVTVPRVRRLSHTRVNLGIPSTVNVMKDRLSRRKMGLGQAGREEY